MLPITRSYYKAQDQLISAFEDISLKVDDDLLVTDDSKKQRELTATLSRLTLIVNVVSTELMFWLNVSYVMLVM